MFPLRRFVSLLVIFSSVFIELFHNHNNECNAFLLCSSRIITASATNNIFRSSSFHPRIDYSSFSTLLLHADEGEGSADSVHLKLYQRHEQQQEEEEGEDSSMVEESELQEEEEIDLITIHQFVNKTNNNQIVLASSCCRNKLEHLSKHLYHRNFSITPNIQYVQRKVNVTDTEEYQRYLELWREGRYMSAAKSMSSEWRRRNRAENLKPSLPEVLRSNTNRFKMLAEDNNSVSVLMTFLREQHINNFNWKHLQYDSSANRDVTMKLLKEFSEWFKQQFPYYYDECYQCGNREGNTYLGTVYPQEDERCYLASRTELYVCGHCSSTSRFPRYNDVCKVLETRKGRCGEYSVLMMLFLQGLGYEARWIVDREDHVWTEVLLDGCWIHVDPCEAAVDEPLLYQGWGKNQTFILAYATNGDIDDVTLQYTSNASAVYERRLEEGVNQTYFESELNIAKQELQRIASTGQES